MIDINEEIRKYEKVCSAAEDHGHQGFRITHEFYRLLISERGRLRRQEDRLDVVRTRLGDVRKQVSWIIQHAGSRSTRPAVRWSFVMELFGLGSTSANELCREYGFRPDEVMGQELNCEEGCECECHHD